MTNTDNRSMEQPYTGSEDDSQSDDAPPTVDMSFSDLPPSHQDLNQDILVKTPNGVEKLRAIFDTAADWNLISERVCERVTSPDQLMGTGLTFRGFSGEEIVPQGRCKLFFGVGRNNFRDWFYVIDDSIFSENFDVLLGFKFIRRSGIFSYDTNSPGLSIWSAGKELVGQAQPDTDAKNRSDIPASAASTPEASTAVQRKVSPWPLPPSPASSEEVGTALLPASDSYLGEVSLVTPHPTGQQWRDMKKEITDLVVHQNKSWVEVGEIIETRHGYGFSPKFVTS